MYYALRFFFFFFNDQLPRFFRLRILFSYESEKFPLTSEIYYIAHRWQPSEGRKKRASTHKHVYGVKKVYIKLRPRTRLSHGQTFISSRISLSITSFARTRLPLPSLHLSSNYSITCLTFTFTIDNSKKARISVTGMDLHENS